jgi:uncharacterized membrane protein YjjP (DUF1212 family)
MLLKNLLIWHVIFGFAGVAFFTAALIGFFKSKLNLELLKFNSFFGFLGFALSWLAGGYYYTKHYGAAVKPHIKAGEYPWIHSIIMETKEHVFLFLPFLGFIALLLVFILDKSINRDLKLKNTAAFLDLLIVILGAMIIFMGFAISGAAIK